MALGLSKYQNFLKLRYFYNLRIVEQYRMRTEREQPKRKAKMPITVADVEKMLTIAAKTAKIDLDTLVKTIYQEEPDVLPKVFQTRAKELIDGKPISQPKEKSVWARKSTKDYAADIGISEEEITIRTGQNGTILLADVKAAFKAKKLATRVVEPEEPKSSEEPEKPKDSKKKTKKPEPAPEPEEDEGDEFDDEE